MIRPRGSVREKIAGRWELRISLGTDGDGRRLTRSRLVKATDAEDARRKLAAWTASLGDEPPDPGLPTVANALERWYLHTSARRETRSNESVRGLLDNHLVPALGHLPVSQVDVGTLERFYARLSASGLSDGTIRHLHYSVRPALRLAVRWGWIERNPADSVELGPLRRRQIRPPSDEDVSALLNAAAVSDPALELFIRLYAVTGARRGEIAALRRSKVAPLDGGMTIDSALTSTKTGLAIKGPKSSWFERPPVRDEMLSVAAGCGRRCDLAAACAPKVWCGDRGGPLSVATSTNPRFRFAWSFSRWLVDDIRR